jgi:hypothetical protein
MSTVEYTVYVEGDAVARTEELSVAVAEWDRRTYNEGRSVPGGISVQEFRDGLMVRDGWIMHVHDDGTVFLSSTIRAA